MHSQGCVRGRVWAQRRTRGRPWYIWLTGCLADSCRRSKCSWDSHSGLFWLASICGIFAHLGYDECDTGCCWKKSKSTQLSVFFLGKGRKHMWSNQTLENSRIRPWWAFMSYCEHVMSAAFMLVSRCDQTLRGDVMGVHQSSPVSSCSCNKPVIVTALCVVIRGRRPAWCQANQSWGFKVPAT